MQPELLKIYNNAKIELMNQREWGLVRQRVKNQFFLQIIQMDEEFRRGQKQQVVIGYSFVLQVHLVQNVRDFWF